MLAMLEILLVTIFVFINSFKPPKNSYERIIQIVISTICIVALFSMVFFTAFSPKEFHTKIHPFPTYYCDMNETTISFVFHNNTQSNQYFQDILFECDGNAFQSNICEFEREIGPDSFVKATCALDMNYKNCYLNDTIIGTRQLGYSHQKCE